MIRRSTLLELSVIAVGLSVLPSSAAGPEDGVALSVISLGGGDVSLEWSGGIAPYQVFRSDDPALVEFPARKLGDTSATSWADLDGAPGLSFYRIAIDPEGGIQKGITRMHNDVRGQVPVEIPPLSWDPAVAAVAQAWADNCSFEHNPSRGSLGENLYARVPPTSVDGQLAVDAWAAEGACYDVDTDTCDIACLSCGHYTQVVWSTTERLGCGMAVCDINSPFGINPWEFWVCNYDPPGNIGGQTPY